MPDIHPTALVDRRAELADDVCVGAYSIIKGHVVVGPGTVVQEHCHIHGHTVIGRNGRIGPSAFLGLPPQHLKFNGENTSLIIGDDVIIREMASLHRSTHAGMDHATRIGDRCFLMAGAHVGHDSVVGSDVILANNVLVGGHVVLHDKCFIGGGAALHQWIRVGRLAIVGGGEAVTLDVPPFAAVRYRALKGYNAIGCRRAGISQPTIHALRAAYHCIHKHRTMPAAVEAIKETIPMLAEIKELLDFISLTRRGIINSIHARNPAPKLYGDSTPVAAAEDEHVL